MSRPKVRKDYGLRPWLVMYTDEGNPCQVEVVARDKADAIRELWRVRSHVAFVSAVRKGSGAGDAFPADAENSSPLPPEGPDPSISQELAPVRTKPQRRKKGVDVSPG